MALTLWLGQGLHIRATLPFTINAEGFMSNPLDANFTSLSSLTHTLQEEATSSDDEALCRGSVRIRLSLNKVMAHQNMQTK